MLGGSSWTAAAVVETRLTAADGITYDADVVYFDPSSRDRVIQEVSMVTSLVTEKGVGRGESQPRHPKLLKKR